MAGRVSVSSVEFYVQGDDEITMQACGVTTSKTLFSDNLPAVNGLYDAHYGTTELTYNCQTCFKNKINCTNHPGRCPINYPLQSPIFRKDILKWAIIICPTCKDTVRKIDLPPGLHPSRMLNEHVKMHKSGTDKHRKCHACGNVAPWVTRDPSRPGVLYTEWYAKGVADRKKAERKTLLLNNTLGDIFAGIPDRVVLALGKSLQSHPRKLILRQNFQVPGVGIRPEIRRIGGFRSSQSDVTALMRTLIEYNAQIPKEIPAVPDTDLHNKLVLMDLTFFEMIHGSSPNTGALRLVTNTNKVTHSLVSRLNKKTGRLRGNLMGRRTTKMMRSVIIGDKAMPMNCVGIPKLIARSMWKGEATRPWTRDRLQTYVVNGPHVYPGCLKIKRVETGREHYIEQLGVSYVLQDGDIVYRNLIDGDPVGFSREPALAFTSVTVLNAKIVTGLSMRMNSGICVLFNADFDGDEMNGILMTTEEAQAETRVTSTVNSWFVSYKNSEPIFGLFQDSVIGIYELTQGDVTGITRYHAMQMCNRVNVQHPLVFDKPVYTGRELVTMFLPPINYDGKPTFYVPEFAPYMPVGFYSESNTKVRIRNGVLESGVLDKASCGQGAEGGIFHIIYNDYGAAMAINTIYNLMQVVNYFLSYYSGCTFGLRDIYIDRKTREELKRETAKTIESSIEITKQLDAGKLVPPVGMTIEEYYENLQMGALAHGDEFIKPLMRNLDPLTNWTYKFIFSGAKGARSNLMNLFTSIGSIGIKGKRIRPMLNGRTSPYFQRFDTHPIARGYNPNNFCEGIQPITFPFSSMEARYELIEVALSTAKAGTMSRNGVKNLEDMLASNMRASVKGPRVIQPLYGETGIDTRRVMMVTFPGIRLNDADFNKEYHVDIKDIDRRWQNSHVQSRLDIEYKQLLADRKQYRDIFLNIERIEPGYFIMKDAVKMPVNPSRIVAKIRTLRGETKEALDPVRATDLVDGFCRMLGYHWMNEIKRRSGAPIPPHIESAVTLLRILIRQHLCYAKLRHSGLDYDGLVAVLDRVSTKILESLIDAGTSVGIIAAQCISEPMTQYLLDAKHRSGLRKTKTDTIVRFDEILGNRSTDKLHSPQMLLIPRDEYIGDRAKVVEIANHIEMLSVGQFVNETGIFCEEYGRPVYPGLESERDLITRFATMYAGAHTPRDLVNWCIRYVFNEEELVLKSMKVKSIYLKLMEVFPNLWIVFTQQTRGTQLIMRIYMKNSAFKKSIVDIDHVRDLEYRIRNTIVRGIQGISNTNVKQIAHTRITEDGGMETVKTWAIECDGCNLSDIIENPYLDPYQCSWTGIDQTQAIAGLISTRNRIASELHITLKSGANYEHSTIYADEMTYAGIVTSIARSGMGQREMDAIFLRATTGSPREVLCNAALNNQTNPISGISDAMVMGTTPRFGTTYNDIAIDEDEVRALHRSPDQVLDEL